jgi:hypothetical protein
LDDLLVDFMVLLQQKIEVISQNPRKATTVYSAARYPAPKQLQSAKALFPRDAAEGSVTLLDNYLPKPEVGWFFVLGRTCLLSSFVHSWSIRME